MDAAWKVYVGDRRFDDNQISNLFLKLKYETVGRFTFDFRPIDGDESYMVVGNTLRIFWGDLHKLDGVIQRADWDSNLQCYHVYGADIRGFLLDRVNTEPSTVSSYTSDVQTQVMYTGCDFPSNIWTGAGEKIGTYTFHYKLGIQNTIRITGATQNIWHNVVERGTVYDHVNGCLYDATKNWTANEFAGATLRFVSGACKNNVYNVNGNTSNRVCIRLPGETAEQYATSFVAADQKLITKGTTQVYAGNCLRDTGFESGVLRHAYYLYFDGAYGEHEYNSNLGLWNSNNARLHLHQEHADPNVHDCVEFPIDEGVWHWNDATNYGDGYDCEFELGTGTSGLAAWSHNDVLGNYIQNLYPNCLYQRCGFYPSAVDGATRGQFNAWVRWDGISYMGREPPGGYTMGVRVIMQHWNGPPYLMSGENEPSELYILLAAAYAPATTDWTYLSMDISQFGHIHDGEFILRDQPIHLMIELSKGMLIDSPEMWIEGFEGWTVNATAAGTIPGCSRLGDIYEIVTASMERIEPASLTPATLEKDNHIIQYNQTDDLSDRTTVVTVTGTGDTPPSNTIPFSVIAVGAAITQSVIDAALAQVPRDIWSFHPGPVAEEGVNWQKGSVYFGDPAVGDLPTPLQDFTICISDPDDFEDLGDSYGSTHTGTHKCGVWNIPGIVDGTVLHELLHTTPAILLHTDAEQLADAGFMKWLKTAHPTYGSAEVAANYGTLCNEYALYTYRNG